MAELRAEGLDFVTTAPVILRFEAEVAAPRDVVFAALSGDPSTWTSWFPGLTSGAYTSPPPYGVGSLREVSVKRNGTYRETVVAWDEPTRWAYRVDSSSLPIARALIEDWTLEDLGRTTRVRWDFCVDPSPAFRAGLPVTKLVISRVFHRAMRNLSRQLAR